MGTLKTVTVRKPLTAPGIVEAFSEYAIGVEGGEGAWDVVVDGAVVETSETLGGVVEYLSDFCDVVVSYVGDDPHADDAVGRNACTNKEAILRTFRWIERVASAMDEDAGSLDAGLDAMLETLLDAMLETLSTGPIETLLDVVEQLFAQHGQEHVEWLEMWKADEGGEDWRGLRRKLQSVLDDREYVFQPKYRP